MPETRTFDFNEDDDFAKFVRDAIGAGPRPVEPGRKQEPIDHEDEDDDEDEDGISLVDLPVINF